MLSRFFLAAVVVLAVLLLPWGIRHTETSVKVSALLLELMGIGAVAIGLRDTQRQFGMEPPDLRLRAAVMRGWRRVARLFRRPIQRTVVLGTAEARVGAAVASGHLSVWRVDPVDASIEQRLAVLWQNVEELKGRFEFTNQRTREGLQQRDETIARERRERREETERLDRMLREYAVGGLQLEGMGLVALLVSVPVGLFSKELDASLRSAVAWLGGA
jgi:hypothetical protein